MFVPYGPLAMYRQGERPLCWLQRGFGSTNEAPRADGEKRSPGRARNQVRGARRHAVSSWPDRPGNICGWRWDEGRRTELDWIRDLLA